MRWQRGLFGLWIVLSAFWIAGVGAVTWATFPRLLTDAEFSILANPQKPGVPDDVVPDADDPPASESHQEVRSAEPAVLPDDGVSDDVVPDDVVPDADDTPASESHQEVRSAERLAYVQRAAILGVAPPIFVLVVGAALAWMARGFRT
jgi:hypothetical protein